MGYRPDYEYDVTIKVSPSTGLAKLESVKPTTPPDETFGPHEGLAVFALIKANKLPMSNGSFWLAGIQPAVDKEAKDGKTYAYAYSSAQVQAFEAKSCTLKRNRFGQPCLWLYATEYTPKARQVASSGLKRVEPAPAAKMKTLKR